MKLSTILVLLPQVVRSASDWNIGPATTTKAGSVIAVSHTVGDEADGVMLNVYSGLCSAGGVEVAADNVYATFKQPDGETCWTDFKYNIDIDESQALDADNPFSDEPNKKMEFCVKATTFEGEGDDKLSVNFEKTSFELDFSNNLNGVSFSATTYGVEEEDAQTATEDYSVSATVSACVCSENDENCVENPTKGQDEFVYICIGPQTGFTITTFDMKMKRENYEIYSVTDNAADALTEITEVGSVKKVKTPIVQGLVEASNDPRNPIEVSGSADLAVGGGRAGSESQFEMEIAVNRNCEENSIIGALLGMSN